MTTKDSKNPRRHILTVVLEDYFQVGAFSRVVTSDHWYRFDQRARDNTLITLDLLDAKSASATFFVAGWIAENYPNLIAEITGRGHEVAIQGYRHCNIDELTVDEFRRDLLRGKRAVEDATGMAVLGFRIGRGKIKLSQEWALETVAECGLSYDSSFLPLGLASTWQPHLRIIHCRQAGNGEIWEVPPSSLQWGLWCLPMSGGNYMRQLPKRVVDGAIEKWISAYDAPLVFYFHVWELDPEQPRITSASLWQKIRHYRNLDVMGERVSDLLSRYRLTSIANYLGLDTEKIENSPRIPSNLLLTGKEIRGKKQTGTQRFRITIVVPCYNEEDSLTYLDNTLQRFSKETAAVFDVHYVFVDDCSTDGTWEKLQALFADKQLYTLVKHKINKGLAGATHTGIIHAPTEIVGVIDCDCSYDPLILLDMVPLLTDDVSVVVSSPYHPLGGVINVPFWRLIISKMASWCYRRVLDQKLYTYTSCFRVYRRSSVNRIKLTNERYVGLVEILVHLSVAGARIVEHPAVLNVRQLGDSKMKLIENIKEHLGLIVRCIVWRKVRSKI